MTPNFFLPLTKNSDFGKIACFSHVFMWFCPFLWFFQYWTCFIRSNKNPFGMVTRLKIFQGRSFEFFFKRPFFWLKFCNFACFLAEKVPNFCPFFFGKIEPVWKILYTDSPLYIALTLYPVILFRMSLTTHTRFKRQVSNSISNQFEIRYFQKRKGVQAELLTDPV